MWHEAARRIDRRKSSEDVIAAAKWLIDKKYTSATKLGLHSLSAGGAVGAAAVNMRPDLFGAFVVEVAKLDHLHSLPSAWEYGSLEDPKAFRNILSLSPYQNIRAGACYPATLVTVTAEDANAALCYKFGAALQYAQGCARPVVVRIGENETHLPRGQLGVTRHASTVSFLYHNLRDRHGVVKVE